MALTLKIAIPADHSTKLMKFADTMSVHDVIRSVQEKIQMGGEDHGIFQPSPEGDPSFSGKWLANNKPLEVYDVKNNDTLEYKKKHEMLKVKLIDDTMKTMLIDTSLPVSEVIQFIGKKVGIKDPNEFGIIDESKTTSASGQVWLKVGISIPEQVKNYLNQTFPIKKRFFWNDSNVGVEDPVQLHLIYCQARDEIIAGNHPTSKDEAIDFGALQAQISVGNFNPDVHKPGFLKLPTYLPPQYRKKEIENLVLSEWKKQVGMDEVNARFRYVQKARGLATYGMTCFKVREKMKDKNK